MQIDPRCDTNQSFLSLPLFLHSAKQDHRVSATGNPIVVDEMFIILLEATIMSARPATFHRRRVLSIVYCVRHHAWQCMKMHDNSPVTTIRFDFDSTGVLRAFDCLYQRSLRSQWRNTGHWPARRSHAYIYRCKNVPEKKIKKTLKNVKKRDQNKKNVCKRWIKNVDFFNPPIYQHKQKHNA